jgi:hypothetical protein
VKALRGTEFNGIEPTVAFEVPLAPTAEEMAFVGALRAADEGV